MLKGLLCISVAATLVAAPNVLAQTVAMTDLNSKKSAGTIEISQSDYGVVFMPQLSGLSSGITSAIGSCSLLLTGEGLMLINENTDKKTSSAAPFNFLKNQINANDGQAISS